jgi:GxxExxY protein
MKIEVIKVNKILDSRGEWTIEVEIISDGIKEKASIPSGKSKGSYEAISLNYEEIQNNLKQILNDVKNIDFRTSKEFDQFLIERAGKNKEKLGANFTLGASIAFARVLAKKEGLELWEYLTEEYTKQHENITKQHEKFYVPGLILNIIGGGVHSKNNLDFQEYWLTADLRGYNADERGYFDTQINADFNTDLCGYFDELLAKILEIINKLKEKLPKPLGRNDEGAFCTNFSDNYEPFLYLKEVIHELNTNNNTRINHELGELNTNNKNENINIIFKDLSYKIIGILYEIHKQLGTTFKEEHYKQAIKSFLQKEKIPFITEKILKLETDKFSVEGIRADFIIDNKILLEIKAKSAITKEDIRQVYRYLIASQLPLGIIVNFRSKKLIFKRILNPSVLKKFDNATNSKTRIKHELTNTNESRIGRMNHELDNKEFETNSLPFVKNSRNNIRDKFGTIRDEFVYNIIFELGADIAANQINKNLNWNEVYAKLKDLEVIYLEDPFKEDEFENFANLRKQGFKVIGDDLTVTNVERLKIALKKNSVDGVIVKPNQVGTILETFEFVKLAKENNLFTIFSHRSGETNDHWLIDLGIAFKADFFKIGPPVQGERVAKYNRLREILEKF